PHGVLGGVKFWTACACLKAATAAAIAACGSTTVGSNVLVPEGTCARSPGDHHATTMTSATVTNMTETRRVRIDTPPVWRATEPGPAARAYSPAERGQMRSISLQVEVTAFHLRQSPAGPH